MPLPDDDDDSSLVVSKKSSSANAGGISIKRKKQAMSQCTIRRKRKRHQRPNRHRHRHHASVVQEINEVTLENLTIRIVPILVEASNDDATATTTTTTAAAAAAEQQQAQQQLGATTHNINNQATTTTTTRTTCRTVPPPPKVFWLRLIDPYPYTFVSFAKARWVGRTIFDVYTSEFKSYPPSYYRYAIQTGRIQVIQRRKNNNNKNDHCSSSENNSSSNNNNESMTTTMTTVSCDYRVQAPDALCHTVHRHEPAVQVVTTSYCGPQPTQMQILPSPLIKIVGETAEVLAVDKPSTLPVHPCGGYHQNSLIPLLERERNNNTDTSNNDDDHDDDDNTTSAKKKTPKQKQQQHFYTIHRLDRLTSGLVILAKSSLVAAKWAKAILERRSCTKLYLARVRGRFPMNIIQSSSSGVVIPRLSGEQHQFPVYGEWKEGEQNEAAVRKKEEVAEKEVEWLRKRNAFGYWMTTLRESVINSSNSTGCDDDGSVTRISLEEFSSIKNTTQEWLNVLSTGRNGGALSNTSAASATKRLTWLHFACPVRIANIKDGVCESGTFENLGAETYLRTVKPAQTSFAPIAYDSTTDTTVVLCRPGTGRTHQIRVHLQHLGHPIANDPNYTHDRDMWYADPLGNQVCQNAKACLDAMDAANSNRAQEDTPPLQESLVTSDVPATETEIDRMLQLPHRTQNESSDEFLRRTCVWCARSGGQQEERNKKEFLVRSPGIWLHALQYRVKLDCCEEPVCFTTDPPSWCNLESSDN